jgi:beta-xylosidase
MRKIGLILVAAFSVAAFGAENAAPTSKWVKFTSFTYQPTLAAGTTPAPTENAAYTDDFDSETLASRWTGMRGPNSRWFATSKAAKALYLEPRRDRLSEADPSFLGVQPQSDRFSCTITLSAQPTTMDGTAGLAAYQNDSRHYAINVKIAGGHLTDISLDQAAPRRVISSRAGSSLPMPAPMGPTLLAAKQLPENLTSVTLRIQCAGPVMKCFYQTGSGEFLQLGPNLESSHVAASGFPAFTVGMFAYE